MFLLRVHIDRYCETNVRASSYIIYVDLPGEDDVLLVHGYTGAYDLVSRSVAEFLQHREPPASAPLYGSWTAQHQRGDVLAPPSEEVIDTLRERGYLTELSQDQEQAVVGRIAEALHRKSLRGSLNFILMPTYDCNLRCGYCFQDYMRTNPSYSYLLEPMSRGMADRIFAAMDFLMKERGIDASQPRSIGLFGGEPLLARNRPIIEHIVSRAAETKSPLSAVTNATELAAYRDLLSPREIAQVQITLDGIPSEHDRRRIRADGGGTFEAIASNIDLALDRGVYVTIRVNVDRRNVAQLPAMACLFAEHGWIGSASFSAYVAPIRPANTNVVVGDTFDNWDLSEALRRLSANHPEVAIFDTQDRELEDTALRIFQGQPGAMPPMKESYCGAHTGMFVFDPKGDVYACWERTGDSRIRVGRVTEDGRVETESTQFQLWRSRTVASNPVCNKCRYSFHCGGGCAVLAFGRSGEYHTNFCDGFAARFRANAAKAFLKHKAGEISRPQIARLCSE